MQRGKYFPITLLKSFILYHSRLYKEVFQPHLPVRLPCYDLTLVTGFTLDSSSMATIFRHPQLPWFDGRCVQGPGTYSPRHG